jgi:hypothetical protein
MPAHAPLSRRDLVLAAGALLLAAGCGTARGGAEWPQAAGPLGTWRIEDAAEAPARWSVARMENVSWRAPLPGPGQGGIAIAGDRLFLTTFAELAPGQKESNAVLGHALDRKSGRVLWSVRLEGGRPSPIAYAFSDATSWTPLTDGVHVWFFDSAGEMGCWTVDGREVWRRKFRGVPAKYPFNRQHEPILTADDVISLEPLSPGEPGYRADRDDWNYLRGIDRLTGRPRWVAEDATTHYATAVAGRLADGRPAILHGRGGPHDVPERPIGLTMTSLARGEEGRTIWRFQPEPVPGGPVDGTTWQALYTLTWDARHAYWFRHAPEAAHLVLDASTGKLLREQPLARGVDVRRWDPSQGRYVAQLNVDVATLDDPAFPLAPGQTLHVFPAWHSNVVAGGHHWFLASTGHHRNGHAPRGHSGPAHCLGRVAIESGKVEYLELPVGVERRPGAPDQLIYGRAVGTRTVDAGGHDLAAEDRSRTDGWQIAAFFPSPIVLGARLYVSALLGVTYVVDTRAPVLDEHALVSVSDLGPLGETWSLSGPSYAGGVLYHRSLREVVAIGPAGR